MNNVNIIIVQILIRLHYRKYNTIGVFFDALREYARTYTRNPIMIRANLFIKMVLRVESAQFHRAAVERKTKGFLKKLIKQPLSLGQNLSVEVIPFPTLWGELLKTLDNKFQK